MHNQTLAPERGRPGSHPPSFAGGLPTAGVEFPAELGWNGGGSLTTAAGDCEHALLSANSVYVITPRRWLAADKARAAK